MSELTDEEVIKIRKLYLQGCSVGDLAWSYCENHPTIVRILDFKTYQHLEDLKDEILAKRAHISCDVFGRRNSSVKLTDSDKEQIIALSQQGHRNVSIAKQFNVSSARVGQIIRGSENAQV
jgi:hypothetical protein